MDFDLNNNTVYYFCSTLAQVWAALIAFGGIALRDRLSVVRTSQDELFKLIHANLSQHREHFKDCYPKITPDAWLEKHRFIKAIKDAGPGAENFLKRLSTNLSDFGKQMEAEEKSGGYTSDSIFGHFRAASDYFKGLLAECATEAWLQKTIRNIFRYSGAMIIVSIAMILFAEQAKGNCLFQWVFVVVAPVEIVLSVVVLRWITQAFAFEVEEH